jgi:diguanylate cyclase (GGDEF)-like protein
MPCIAGACCVAGHGGILAGLRRQLGLPTEWKLLAGLACLVLAVLALPCLVGIQVERVLVVAPSVAAIDLSAAWLIWRHVRPEARPAYMPLCVLELLYGLQAVARAALLLTGVVESALVQVWISLSLLVFLCAVTMACLLIVTHQQEQALRRASLTDAMTGWLNRRALHDIAWREFRRCRHMCETAYFITFDIDHFKAVNEHYGHSVGDAAICHVAGLATEVVRGSDVLFRISGEEFAVLLTDATPTDACRIAEGLRDLVARSPLPLDGERVPLTVSVGIAGLEANDVQWEDILRRADQALYYAKQHGRNRVSALGIDCAGQPGALPLRMETA